MRQYVGAAASVAVGPAGADGPPGECAPRRYYLTKTVASGAQAKEACALGFHFAALWEILDPTVLKYDTTLGYVQADSGYGPPSGFSGWVRTGSSAAVSQSAGQANCQAWSQNSGSGTVLSLSQFWDQPSSEVSPWRASWIDCGFGFQVWCVENR